MTTIPMKPKQAKILLARAHKFWRGNKRPDSSRRAITRSAVDVFSVLIHLSRMGECVPSIGYLSKRTSYSRSTVVRALRDLRLAGLVAIQRRRQHTPEGSRQTSNRYT
jgi:DNA-binding transcriptional ArsR family regulator